MRWKRMSRVARSFSTLIQFCGFLLSFPAKCRHVGLGWVTLKSAFPSVRPCKTKRHASSFPKTDEDSGDRADRDLNQQCELSLAWPSQSLASNLISIKVNPSGNSGTSKRSFPKLEVLSLSCKSKPAKRKTEQRRSTRQSRRSCCYGCKNSCVEIVGNCAKFHLFGFLNSCVTTEWLCCMLTQYRRKVNIGW
jgi:hypothetical protein